MTLNRAPYKKEYGLYANVDIKGIVVSMNKYDANDGPIVYLTLAVTRPWFNRDGSSRLHQDFVACVAYNRIAKNLLTVCKPGNRVHFKGHLTNVYDPNGKDLTSGDRLRVKVKYYDDLSVPPWAMEKVRELDRRDMEEEYDMGMPFHKNKGKK
jgi:hypothetical protein